MFQVCGFLFSTGDRRVRRSPIRWEMPSCEWQRAIFTVIAAASLLAFPTVTVGQRLPPEMKSYLQRAEEAFFDGQYADADRLLAEAEDWLSKPVSKRTLQRLGLDHSVLIAAVWGLRAEIYLARGQLTKTNNTLRRAMDKLLNRRSRLLVRGGAFPGLWQYEAFLKFVEGDLECPNPEFGIALVPDIPDAAKEILAGHGDLKEARRAYSEAEAILGDPIVLRINDEAGLRFSNRLEGRLFLSLARLALVESDPPSETNVDDAGAFLGRAEAAFSRDEVWRLIISPDSGTPPRSLKDFEQQGFDPEKRLQLKRLYGQVIKDYTKLMVRRAELTAYTKDDPDALGEARNVYQQLGAFLSDHYRPRHPLLQEMHLSKSRWLMETARNSERAAADRFSLLKECLEGLGEVTSLPFGDMLQRDALELAARSGILVIHLEEPVLEDEEVAEHRQRIKALAEALVEAHAEAVDEAEG